MTLYKVFLQTGDLGLKLFDFLDMVSRNASTRGNRKFIIGEKAKNIIRPKI
jgi:hypothetical protein